jgi:hypothetical protein
LKIDLGGSLHLNPSGGLAGVDLRGAFALGIQPPGQGQVFPLVMHSFHEAIEMNAAVPAVNLRLNLARIRNFLLLGTNLSLPTPRVELTPKEPPATIFSYKTFNLSDYIPTADFNVVYPSTADGSTPVQAPSGFDATVKWSRDGHDVLAPAIKLPTTPNFDIDLIWNPATMDFALDVIHV